MNIGSVIRKLRVEQGATLEQLALEIGTDAGNLSRIERGTQQPALYILEPISRALKISPAELIAAACDTEAQAVSTELDDIKQLLRNYRMLNPENQHLAIEFVRLLNRLQPPQNHTDET
ncbi:helix-turn-helix domain-containing protein [Iodobacter ciconiae]|uniref:Helix-turn-helix domain-containing protein n=1 Tax=Iodobacter ciconiae TaxID=2496266 RepID=A0A3S8ZVJ9_9NEIS|nr:helix-turn-helix transcriptional regulator [Iodobacter ciconiae]AZN37486.1 helix-turn-helix domain-containing protein [Iodobacter ciconiae]